MTVKELKTWQDKFKDLIDKQARRNGLVTNKIEPVYDGVIDAEEYLKSDLKVAWMLKEPYDDFDTEGKPYGGGWSFQEGFSDRDENWVKRNGTKHWTNPIWQKIVYVMYGYLNGLDWDSMPWIRTQPQMMDAILSVALFNVSKMPAKTNSCDGMFRVNFNNYWRDVVEKQLEVYNPDVVIFGYTFSCFKPAWEPDLKYVDESPKGWVRHYMRGKRHLLDTYHPGRKGCDYVNDLIHMLTSIKKPR